MMYNQNPVPGAKGSGATRIAGAAAALFAAFALLTGTGCNRPAESAADTSAARAAAAAHPPLSAEENKAKGMAAIDANTSLPPAQKQALKDQLGRMGTKH